MATYDAKSVSGRWRVYRFRQYLNQYPRIKDILDHLDEIRKVLEAPENGPIERIEARETLRMMKRQNTVRHGTAMTIYIAVALVIFVSTWFVVTFVIGHVLLWIWNAVM